MRLSTTWDKFEIDGEKVSKKVFMLRGDEAYARTTDCIVTCSNVRNTFYEGFKVNVRVDVLRGLGSSVCYLYDGEQKLGQFNTTTNVTSHTFEDLQLSYDAEHDIKAVYMGSEQCLKSQSKTQQLYEDIPDQFKVNIAIDNTTVYPSSTSITKTATLSGILGDSSYNNIDVLWYVDGEYVETTNTGSSTSASCNIGTLSDGNHTIMAEVETKNNLYGNRTSETISIGYNISIVDYPTTFLNNGTDKVTVSVLDYNNNPVSGATVTFATYTATTDSNGVASITIPYIEDGTYTATCGGDSSESIVVHAIGITGLTLTTDKAIVQDGETALLTATLTGGRIRSVPVTFTLASGETATLNTDANGRCEYVYTGTGVGDNIATATVSDYTATVNIEDTMLYFTPDRYSTDPKYLYTADAHWKRYSKYIDWTLYRRVVLTFGKVNQKLGYSTEIEMNIISQNNLDNTDWSIMGMGQSPLFKLTTGKLRIVIGNNADSYVSVYMNDELVARKQGVSEQGISLYCLQMTAGTNLQFDSLKIKRIEL